MLPPSNFTDDWLKKNQNPFLNIPSPQYQSSSQQSGNPFLNVPSPQHQSSSQQSRNPFLNVPSPQSQSNFPQSSNPFQNSPFSPQSNFSFVTTPNPFTTTTTPQSNQPQPSSSFINPQNASHFSSLLGNNYVSNAVNNQRSSSPQIVSNVVNNQQSNSSMGQDHGLQGVTPLLDDEGPEFFSSTKETRTGSLKGDEMTLKQRIDKRREFVGHRGKVMSFKSVAKRLTSPKKHKKVKQIAKDAMLLTNISATWAAQNHADDLAAMDWSTNPWYTGNILNGQFPKGPLLTGAQLLKIDEFSRSDEGSGWLSAAGILTIEEAIEYLVKHKYQTWLKLEASSRLLLASLAWKYREDYGIPLEAVVDTPPYRLGRSMEVKSLSDKDQGQRARKGQLRQEVDSDIRKEWLKTFVDMDSEQEIGSHGLQSGVQQTIRSGAMKKATKSTKSPDKANVRNIMANDILKKVLLLLHSGMQLYSKKSFRHEDYSGPVARALSHGGRVNIRIPSLANSTDNPYTLTDWLGITTGGGSLDKTGPVDTRPFGTHHIEIGENARHGNTSVPGTGSFRETGATTASGKNMGNTELYGVDLAVGGMGKRDFNGDVILPDGAHGHLFIGYRAPTMTKDGALQIGIETTAPGAPSTVGYHHGPESSEATANPESSFGGLKQDKIGDQITPKAKLGGSSTTMKYKDTETIHDSNTFKSHTITSEDSITVKEHIDDEATMGRFVNLHGKHGNNWLSHLQKLEESFNILQQETSTVQAYEDLIGEGRQLKKVANRKEVTLEV
jgi:hypothetical protein